MAGTANPVLLPTGLSLDDMPAQVVLAHELVKKGRAQSQNRFRALSGRRKPFGAYRGAGYRVLTGAIAEKTAYRRSADEGHAPTETRLPSLNARADKLAQSVVNLNAQLQKGKAA